MQTLRRDYGTVDNAEDKLGIAIDAYMDDEETPSLTPSPLSLPPSITVDLNHLTECQKQDLLRRLLPGMLEQFAVNILKDFAKDVNQTNACTLIKECCNSKGLNHIEVLDDLLGRHLKTLNVRKFPDKADFISLSVTAMQKLATLGKENLIYKWPRCIALTRPESEESLMPLQRMPFGLIEYQIDVHDD